MSTTDTRPLDVDALLDDDPARPGPISGGDRRPLGHPSSGFSFRGGVAVVGGVFAAFALLFVAAMSVVAGFPPW